ncbi:hypothetical protein RCL_jg28042.t1 [Rhizophagus clarus]|uniref:Uncharacterized protein n=1 Tax=Rhizophagus clarus TaxID=94130 RepID=A0A8H3M1A2_9GLOM|nr:hypothetical protein RCL_jg28042.t1 [Rhizophagus clarus]
MSFSRITLAFHRNVSHLTSLPLESNGRLFNKIIEKRTQPDVRISEDKLVPKPTTVERHISYTRKIFGTAGVNESFGCI